MLRGTGEPGATCQIRDGDILLGPTVVHDDGTWSWEGTALLSTGVHHLTVTLVDLQGNSSPTSDPTTLTISSTPAGGGTSSGSEGGGCGLGGALTGLLVALGLALYRRR